MPIGHCDVDNESVVASKEIVHRIVQKIGGFSIDGLRDVAGLRYGCTIEGVCRS